MLRKDISKFDRFYILIAVYNITFAPFYAKYDIFSYISCYNKKLRFILNFFLF